MCAWWFVNTGEIFLALLLNKVYRNHPGVLRGCKYNKRMQSKFLKLDVRNGTRLLTLIRKNLKAVALSHERKLISRFCQHSLQLSL